MQGEKPAGPDVEVAMLGRLRVRVAGSAIAVTAPRVRDLLGVLALSAGDMVAVETIGSRLWSDDPPNRVRPTLQNLIFRLRTVIGHEVVQAWPKGYSLDIPRRNVDVLRFVSEVETAGQLPVPDDERRRLGAALDLWLGDPFADMSSAWFTEAAAPGLIERYLAARERRIDLDIAAGAFESLLAELHDLTAEHPLRESLWLRLIRVLEVTGRRAEALASYEEVRTTIAEELGVDPGPELRVLHARLLTADSSQPSVVAPAPPVPRQLPPTTRRIFGREIEMSALNELAATFTDADQLTEIVVICGVGGVGKTTLAVHWAHEVRHLFPDGQLYLNLRGFDIGEAVSPASALRILLSGLGVRAERVPEHEAAQTALLRTTLAGRRMLFLFDNARDAQQIRPLLPADGCLVVVTSRDRLRGLVVREGAHRITLTALSPTDSAQLIRSILPHAGQDDVAELATLCWHLPLALAIAAEHATRRTGKLSGLIRMMREGQSMLDAFEDIDESGDLRAIFSWSHRALDPSTARLYELLGLYPGADFAAPAVAALAGQPGPDTRRQLNRLADLHLLNEKGDGRYEMHDLVRNHASELASRLPDEVRTPSLDRLFSWFVHTSHGARLLRDDRGSIIPLPTPLTAVIPLTFDHATDAIKWFDEERDGLAAVIRLAHATGRDQVTYELVESCEGDLSGRDLDLLTELLTLALESSTRLEERLPEAFIRNSLGLRCSDQGDDYEQAIVHFQLALKLFTVERHEIGQARALGNLAIAHDGLGRYNQAIELYERSLAIKRRIGDDAGVARSLGNLAHTYYLTGRIDQAAKAAGEAIRHYRQNGSRRGEGTLLDTLGSIERARGRYDESLSCLRESLRLHRDLGYPWGEAVVLTNLGRTYDAAGMPAQAADAWRRALTICDQIQAPRSDDLDREELLVLLATVSV